MNSPFPWTDAVEKQIIGEVPDGMVRTVIDLPTPPEDYDRIVWKDPEDGEWFLATYERQPVWIWRQWHAPPSRRSQFALVAVKDPKYKVVQNDNGVWGVERSTDYYVAACANETDVHLTRDDLSMGGDGGIPPITWIGPGMFKEAKYVPKFPESVPGFKAGTWFALNKNGGWISSEEKPFKDLDDGWSSKSGVYYVPRHLTAADVLLKLEEGQQHQLLFQVKEDG